MTTSRIEPSTQEAKPAIRVGDNEIIYHQINGQDNYNKSLKCTYFIIVLFNNGSGIHAIDGVNHSIGKQQLHFLFPGQHHHWETGADTYAQRITIGRKLFETFSSMEVFHFIRYNPHPVFKLENDVFQALDLELKAISEHIHAGNQDDKSWKEILSIRMDILMLLINREVEHYILTTVLKKASLLVQEFWQLISKYYAQQKGVSWYADQLQVNPSYLNASTKKHFNMTAKQLIGQRVLLAAKQQLRLPHRSIKEIAIELGFAEVAGFTNYFKKQCGFSPSEYRL
ncbi:helix-turn-helix domain-containing protein [Chitinophaga defluvii]|uniref:Helix-turn-helix transcriptional regulator n=1 Tax=Chitinophaga defluvii TaxID=3163343 RepID=A0ABV2SZA8_9BACT